MKPKQPSRSWLRCITAAVLLMVFVQQAQAEINLTTVKSTVIEKKEEEDEKNKTKSSRKTARELRAEKKASPVKLSPDLFTSAVHVTAKDKAGELDFYVFGLDGTLIQHHKMKAGAKKKINGLAKGKYTYQVFSGDAEKAAGEFEVR
jgi:hypothetical protein